MVGVYCFLRRCVTYYFNHSKLPGNKSSDCKSGEEFENGIMNVNGEFLNQTSQNQKS